MTEAPRLRRLEDLTPGARVRGVLPDRPVTVVAVEWHGTSADAHLPRRRRPGRPRAALPQRRGALEIEEAGRAWSFDADGKLFRLASEALRIRLAHLFDPYLAVHTSNLDPLPHQIRAVYGEMLPRQPLRFLLADDPGAGKTIMAGLLIKELIVRGDLKRCLIVAAGQPGRAVAGRARAEARARVRDHHARHDRGVAERQPVRREEPRHRPARPAVAQRRDPGEARADRLGSDRRRRGAQDVGALLRATRCKKTRRYQLGELLGRHHAPPAADDGDAAQRQAGGLPAVHGADRPRPVRGQAAQGREGSSTRRD